MSNEIIITIIGLIVIGIIIFFVSKNIKKALQVMFGWGLYEAYNFSFDFLIWPIIQGLFGFMGIIGLIFIALINNFIILLWYQKKKTDWLGVNVFEDMKTKGHLWVSRIDSSDNVYKKISLFIPAKILKFAIWLLNKNDIFAFVTLSVWQDSFITTIFLRHGKFDKLDKRDYIIFITSTIFSCAIWSLLMQILILIAELIFSLH